MGLMSLKSVMDLGSGDFGGKDWVGYSVQVAANSHTPDSCGNCIDRDEEAIFNFSAYPTSGVVSLLINCTG